jgi:hypothetical protein
MMARSQPKRMPPVGVLLAFNEHDPEMRARLSARAAG